MARIRPTVVSVDIEGAERELVPVMPWDTVDWVIIDLHPDVIGRDDVAAVLETLGAAGLRANRRKSSTNKKLLVRR